MLSRSAEKLSLNCTASTQQDVRSKLDECSLLGCDPLCVKLPFFPDLHTETSRSWKQPYSAWLINAAAADFTRIAGSVEQGYAGIPSGGYIGCVSFPVCGFLLELSACFAIQTLQDYLCPGRQVLCGYRFSIAHNVCVTSLLGRRPQGFGQESWSDL